MGEGRRKKTTETMLAFKSAKQIQAEFLASRVKQAEYEAMRRASSEPETEEVVVEGVKTPKEDPFREVDTAIDMITHLSDDDEDMSPYPEADWDNYRSVLEEAIDQGEILSVLDTLYDMQTDANVQESDMPQDFYQFQERVYKAAFGEVVFSIAKRDYEGAGTLLDRLLEHQTESMMIHPSELLVLMNIYNKELAFDIKGAELFHKKKLQKQLRDAEQLRFDFGDKYNMPSEVNGQRVLDLYGDDS